MQIKVIYNKNDEQKVFKNTNERKKKLSSIIFFLKNAKEN